jgi:branched-chain amino acid transport system permease protein
LVALSINSILILFVLGGVTGIIYTLLSEGFSLVYGVAGILNGAYGALYMISDYVVFFFLQVYGLDIISAMLISFAVVFAFGVAVQKLVSLRARTQLEALFITLALAFVLQYLVGFVQCSTLFVSNCQHPPYIPVFIQGSISLLGVSVQNQYVVADILSIIILCLMWLGITRSRIGLAIRAVSQDRRASELVGINTGRITLLVSGIASLMAGVAAVFLASYQTVDPNIGWNVITLAFAIVIIGGLGSLKGTLVASFILAYVQTGVLLFVNTILTDFISLAVLIIVILLEPEGLFGREIRMAEKIETG